MPNHTRVSALSAETVRDYHGAMTCPDCNHKMINHKRDGCHLMDCMCTRRNHTQKFWTKASTKLQSFRTEGVKQE